MLRYMDAEMVDAPKPKADWRSHTWPAPGLEIPSSQREFATQEASMGSSREYWQYARECARWAAQSKDQEDQDLFINMAKAWTNIALVEGDVRKLVPEESRASERPN
jgi:hypothetical protein